MAIELTSKPNTDLASGPYPYGNIRDDVSPGDGTPVSTEVYADFHQFFARMAAMSGIVLNNNPDNAVFGFQYYEALMQVTNPAWVTVGTFATSAEGTWANSGALGLYSVGYKPGVNETALCGVVEGIGTGTGSWTAGTKALFTLPAGARPAKNLTVDARVVKDATSSVEQLSVSSSTGVVSVVIASGTYTTITVFLDGVTFRRI